MYIHIKYTVITEDSKTHKKSIKPKAAISDFLSQLNDFPTTFLSNIIYLSKY